MRPGRGRASHLRQSRRPSCAPFSCPTCTLSTFVGRAAGSQCASPHGWAGDHPTVRHPRRLCPLARFGDSLTHGLESRWVPSSRTSLLVRIEPHGLFSWLFLNAFSLPPCLLSFLLFLPSLTSSTSGSE